MPDTISHTIADAVKVSGLGRTMLYELIGARKIEARKAGNRTLILDASLRAYIAGLPPADIRAGQRRAA
jgi:hypothetical protein